MAGRPVLRCLPIRHTQNSAGLPRPRSCLERVWGIATFGIAGTAIGTADAASSPYLSQLTGDDGGADGPAFPTSTAQPQPKAGSRRTTLRPARSGQSPSPRRRQ